MNNPFFKDSFGTFDNSLPFKSIQPEHFIPALKQKVEEVRKVFDDMKNNSEAATFENVYYAYDKESDLIEPVVHAFYHFEGALNDEKIQGISEEFSQILTRFGNDISLDVKVFARIKELYDRRIELKLNEEQLEVVEDLYKGFIRSGALLEGETRDEYRKINEELSSLSIKFSNNLLAETNNYLLQIQKEEQLAGLPEGVREAAKMTAEEKNKEGWVFTLNAPSFLPLMEYSERPELRREIYEAFCQRAAHDNEFNNEEIIKNIVKLRHKRSTLLGYKNHAEYVLEKRMAKSIRTVQNFLTDLLDKTLPAAKREMEELGKFKKELTGEDLHRYDVNYYERLLKEKSLGLDDEKLRPFFQLEKVLQGAFTIAGKLYGLEFKETDKVEKYSDELRAFEVWDKDRNKYIGLFYTDFFPRETKRGGAWMTDWRGQRRAEGKDIRPHIAIVCNFTKPTETKPSLLSFGEVTTLFHEFGHALHGLLSDVEYGHHSGTNVQWDFVELPSQILENWCYEKEALDLFAHHYESGEKIPSEYVDKLKDLLKFREGHSSVRQITYGLLDMMWHEDAEAADRSAKEIEEAVEKKVSHYQFADNTKRAMSCSFGHIFAGGYSAGYYSYKWAEVLDADAFEAFKEKGLFDKSVAQAFKQNILTKGGSVDPAQLYRNFRGRDPNPDALLRRGGLI